MKREPTDKPEQPDMAPVSRANANESNQTSDAENELKRFVQERRSAAIDYLKLLKEEITKTDRSRTRHTYATWVLVAMFLTLDTNSAEVRIAGFEHLDHAVLLKILPAAIVATYYAMLARTFIQRERLVVYQELAECLFPGEYCPFGAYIKPTHFMLAERWLNILRPPLEQFGNVLMLGVIVTVTMYGPAIAGIYAYFAVLTRYGIHDGLVQAAVVVGLIFLVQALVMLRGLHMMSLRDREGFRTQLRVRTRRRP